VAHLQRRPPGQGPAHGLAIADDEDGVEDPLRGLPAASTVVAVQKTVSVVMRRKSSSNSEKECVIGQSS
jgi:hypothetical protein